jgi:hypothetical protein
MALARGAVCSLFPLALVIWLAAMFSLATTAAAAEPAATLSAPSAAGSVSARSAAVLRDDIRAYLRDVARQSGKPNDAVVRRGVALYREIQADTQLRVREREPLRVALRNKLARWGEQLAQQRSEGLGLPAAVPASVARPKALAQMVPPGQPGQPPGAAAQPPVDHGQELLELIQDTIAPTTWDVRGGNGVVRYWAPGHALVIRQTGDVHEQLGRLLMDMR